MIFDLTKKKQLSRTDKLLNSLKYKYLHFNCSKNLITIIMNVTSLHRGDCIITNNEDIKFLRVKKICKSSLAAGRRSRFLGTPLRVVLVTLVVGNYAPYLQRFISTAEEHFLASRPVTYYILTDNPRVLQPPPPLRPGKQLRVVHIAELPGWERLYLRRLPLLAEAMRDMVGEEGVDFVFCADVDLEFVGAVGEEVLDKLVGVAHAEFYGKTRSELPYERGESVAAVMDEEGEWYYTSELYGGTLSEMLGLTQRCSLLLLQDQAQGVKASAMEESYLNRCFIDHAPSCVLSPEYRAGPLLTYRPIQVQESIVTARAARFLANKIKFLIF
uniref:Uncharacterized protein n=1 Tax=Periophthalmus magnuspinnatus TaxID=409849 RepID=A0A3B4AJ53_9GOBI